MSEKDPSADSFIAHIGESPYFRHLTVGSLARLRTQARQLRYPAGATVFWQGEPSQGLFWLQSGTLKAVKIAPSAREQTLHLIETGETFNEAGAFSTLPNPASVVALTPAVVWHIPGNVLRQLIREDPLLAQSVIDVLSERLRSSAALIEDLSLRPVIGRLARLILEEAEGELLSRPSWYTQNELAARLGTVADVVQRALRTLEGDNLIRVERQQIHIVNRAGLEELAL